VESIASVLVGGAGRGGEEESASEGRGCKLKGAAVKDRQWQYLNNTAGRIAHTDVILHCQVLQRLH